MEIEEMNDRVHQTSEYGTVIKTVAQAKTFFRLLWFDLGLNFNPDDDFAGYGVFDEENVELLNHRMDECFDVLGEGVHDVALNVMQEERQ